MFGRVFLAFAMLSAVFLLDSVNIVGASTSYVCTGYPGNTLGNIACSATGNIIVTNTAIDVGQYSFITVNGITNSIPLSGNVMFSLDSGNVISNSVGSFALNSSGNVIIGLNAFTTNQLTLTANSYSTTNPFNTIAVNTIFSNSTTNTIFGSWTFNAYIFDGFNTFTTNQIPLIQISPALTVPAPVTTSTSVVQLNRVTLSVNAPTTGTSPYTYQWYQEHPGKSYVLLSGATSNSYAFGTSQFTPTGTHKFILQITDSASTPVVVNSSVISVLVNATSVGSNSGGTAAASSGGSTGIYTTRATTATTTVATTASTTIQSTVPTTIPLTTAMPTNTTIATTVATTAPTSAPTTTIQSSTQSGSQNPLSGIINAIAKFFSSLFGG